VDWENDGKAVIEYATKLYQSYTRTIKSISEYFKTSASWSKVTIVGFSVRSFPPGFIFDVAGCSIFFQSSDSAQYCLGLLNSKVVMKLLEALAPTVNYEAGHIAQLPVEKKWQETGKELIVDELVSIAKEDWNAHETSWDFDVLRLLGPVNKFKTIHKSFSFWQDHCFSNIRQMQIG